MHSWCSVDALLTLCWHSVDALLTLCWCSVDTLLTLCWHSYIGVVTSRITILPIQVANTSIMDNSLSTAHGLYNSNPQNRWCSGDTHVNDGAVTVSLSLQPMKAANMMIMNNSEQSTFQFAYLEVQKSLMLCWRSFSGWGCYRGGFWFSYKDCQYDDYG